MTRALFVLLLAAAAPLASDGQTPLARTTSTQTTSTQTTPAQSPPGGRRGLTAPHPNTTSSISGSGRGP